MPGTVRSKGHLFSKAGPWQGLPRSRERLQAALCGPVLQESKKASGVVQRLLNCDLRNVYFRRLVQNLSGAFPALRCSYPAGPTMARTQIYPLLAKLGQVSGLLVSDFAP